MNGATLPARGPSIAELHGYFESARKAVDGLAGGFDVKKRALLSSQCELFANRLLRAPAANIGDILLKIEAAEWLDGLPAETLAAVKDDLSRLKGAKL